MVPEEPVGRLMMRAVAVLTLSCDPLATDSALAPPEIVSVFAPPACSVTAVFPVTCKRAIVWAGTAVAVTLPPELKTSVSSFAGVSRDGDQLPAPAHEAEAP